MFVHSHEALRQALPKFVSMASYDMRFPGTTFWLLLILAVISCNYFANYVVDTWLLSRRLGPAAMSDRDRSYTDNVPDVLKEFGYLPEHTEQFRISFSSQAGAVVRIQRWFL